jgi:hypothetical protein
VNAAIELFTPGESVWIGDRFAVIVEDLGGDALDVLIGGVPFLVTRREIDRMPEDDPALFYDGPPDGFGYPGWR